MLLTSHTLYIKKNAIIFGFKQTIISSKYSSTDTHLKFETTMLLVYF